MSAKGRVQILSERGLALGNTGAPQHDWLFAEV